MIGQSATIHGMSETIEPVKPSALKMVVGSTLVLLLLITVGVLLSRALYEIETETVPIFEAKTGVRLEDLKKRLTETNIGIVDLMLDPKYHAFVQKGFAAYVDTHPAKVTAEFVIDYCSANPDSCKQFLNRMRETTP